MGATALIAVAALAAGSAAGNSSSKMPTLNIEQPPAPPDATPKPADAAATAKKKVSGAQGIQDTILTGPQGLGNISTANAPVKTLLGY